MDKLLIITGPTATGKTAKAVSVARAVGGEIVSADSRQVYRGMDLGTGKDLDEYGTDVPYHMIDIADAGYKYNLYEYLRDARSVISDIRQRGRLPIVCGGTGLYVESLARGIELPEVPANPKLRDKLRDLSLEALTEKLATMKRLHNTTDIDTAQRAIRAIEIETYYAEHPEQAKRARCGVTDFKPVIVCLDIDVQQRRARITARLKERLNAGMIDEVETLLHRGISPDDLIYYGLEYKYVTLFLTGVLTRNEMERQLEIAIHQFAKRQMTWFRGMERRGFELIWMPYDMERTEFCNRIASLLSD